MKNLRNTKINDPKTNKNIPRRNKYILENILLNIFKFCILKYIIKFLQSRDNNKKRNSAFIISRNICKKLAEPVIYSMGGFFRSASLVNKNLSRAAHIFLSIQCNLYYLSEFLYVD